MLKLLGAAPGAIERVRIDAETKSAKFRVIGDERWSDEWDHDPTVSPEQQPSHLAAGICGSGIIEAVAEMFLTGIIRPDGRFDPNLAHDRIQWKGRKGAYVLANEDQTTTGQPILVTQDDVRNIQLAKAALYAGAKLLLNRAEAQEVARAVRYIETAVDPGFQNAFVSAIHLPHQHDHFPHLTGLLPQTSHSKQVQPDRRQRRRERRVRSTMS